MKILIAEDDLISAKLINIFLSSCGHCDLAGDGAEALKYFKEAIQSKDYYDLVCLDVMMPNLDGQETLKEIRRLEKQSGIEGSKEVKIIMTTALDDPKTVMGAFRKGATAYLVKPLEKNLLFEQLRTFELI